MQEAGVRSVEGQASDKLYDSSPSLHSEKASPVRNSSSAARLAQKGPSNGGSRETSCVLSEVLSDQSIDWKLDVEDIHSRSTFKTLESIKE